MHAIAIAHVALKYASTWETPPPTKVFFGERQVLEGKATAFTNGAIEAGIVHSRALLEFMGLKGAGPSTLAVRLNAKKDDVVIENTGLPKLSVESAVRMYAGPPAEAESALAHVIFVANKGLAHTTSAFDRSTGAAHLLEIAFRGIPKLVVEHFYKPLGLKEPTYEITSRPAV
ncbi:hypothetical protein SOM08_20220 [Hydrogenophaga sp. SNF1]|uniref:Uncharacterized protein n=1 Tax=Hydrogenophaga borbori TaxID=2294117 RepID=A0A372EFA4_9BURK|nr:MULTISPECIES: hypothetical protein [Hydrogenophaga]RFP77088.1 hypothetical protein DY262_18970 [Hydrogenophaga borbori]WQB83292.1 hypothetical protein SOM08_20220 [Hydrogenophaga sp. SNF1]